MTRPVTLAITGGIGAGKSEALAAFARHGAATMSADAIVHELISGDDEVRAALEKRFGTTERGAIAQIVFADPVELAWLEALLHPRVRQRWLAWLGEVDGPVAVVEVPLLYETAGERHFDKVVVVTAPRSLREERSAAAGGSREQRLMLDEEKAALADYAFENVGSLEELDRFVTLVLNDIT